jgi:hypothetical protein
MIKFDKQAPGTTRFHHNVELQTTVLNKFLPLHNDDYMQNETLLSIYQKAYQSEYDKVTVPFQKIYENATDKKYAVEYALSPIT